MLEVFVGVSLEQEEALASIGRPAPAPVLIRPMIATGADMSAIPARAAQALGIRPKGSVNVAGYDGRTERRLTYDVRLFTSAGEAVVGTYSFGVEDGEDAEARGLIGRDILAQGVLTYDGPAGTIVFAIDRP